MSESAIHTRGDVAFTHRWYQQFLQRLQSAGYEFRSFSDSLGPGDVVLRHDVDLSVGAAVDMARIEADLGVQSTYCFLLTSPLYNLLEADKRAALDEIQSLGHDLALHFSTHLYWDEDESPATINVERRVGQERSVFDTIAPDSETVSFHRPPEWVLDREFTGFRSTYAPAYFSDIGYVADSSQRWREEPPSVESFPETVQVLTHPGLWRETDGDFDQRVKRAVAETCSHAGRNTREEFTEGSS